MGKPTETALCPVGWAMDITDSALTPGATPMVPIVVEDFCLGELADRSRAEEIRLFTALVIAAARTSGRPTQSSIDRILGVTL